MWWIQLGFLTQMCFFLVRAAFHSNKLFRHSWKHEPKSFPVAGNSFLKKQLDIWASNPTSEPNWYNSQEFGSVFNQFLRLRMAGHFFSSNLVTSGIQACSQEAGSVYNNFLWLRMTGLIWLPVHKKLGLYTTATRSYNCYNCSQEAGSVYNNFLWLRLISSNPHPNWQVHKKLGLSITATPV